VTEAALDPGPRAPPPGGSLGTFVSSLGPAHEIDWPKVYLGFAGMILGQFMAILDIQIVAASLIPIQAGIGANADEIGWVQTIYLLAEVVIIPLTAYLTKMWGTRPVYVTAVGCFILSSIATGLSSSIEMMIFTRALQGLAAGAMIPAGFATAMTVFPPERRVTVQVIFGMVVTLAPTIGPTLGGHLTEWLSWRWLFFINVPPGALVMFLVWRYADFDKGDPRLATGIDWFGLAAMTISVLTMQYVLEEGAGDGWFQDDLILWFSVISVIAGVAFVWRQLTYRQPIVSLAPFRDRNFAIGSMMNLVSGLSLYGGMFVMPLFLGQIRRYSAAEVGTTLLVSGLVMFATGPIVGRVVRYIDLRLAVLMGFGMTAYAMFLGVRVTDDWGFSQFAVLQTIRGVGVMIAMVASSQLSISTLPPGMMKDASGLMNLLRNVGGAIGLAVVSTILTHMTAVHLADLAAGLNPTNLAAQDMMAGLSAMMQEGGAMDPEGAGRKAIGMLLRREASVMAFADAFLVLTAGCIVAALLPLLAAKPPGALSSRAGGDH